MILLAGDLGGTKTALRLFEATGECLRERTYVSNDHASFDDILRDFLAATPLAAACLAVAGPVLDQTARVTNLPWALDSDALRRDFAIGEVRLVNDFYGIAASLSVLGSGDVVTLNDRSAVASAPRVVIGAGTGLGQAILAPDPKGGWIILPSEGGHADFAPSNVMQDELLHHLRKLYGHVSWERVVSGLGIADIHSFLSQSDGPPIDAAEVDRLAEQGDPVAGDAMNLFIEAYGAEAGNLALKALARGGVWIAGGIAAKNVDRMTDGRFMRSFIAKGRFQSLLEQIPVHVITNERAGLLGAANLALELITPAAPGGPSGQSADSE